MELNVYHVWTFLCLITCCNACCWCFDEKDVLRPTQQVHEQPAIAEISSQEAENKIESEIVSV